MIKNFEQMEAVCEYVEAYTSLSLSEFYADMLESHPADFEYIHKDYQLLQWYFTYGSPQENFESPTLEALMFLTIWYVDSNSEHMSDRSKREFKIYLTVLEDVLEEL
jgi:hypothetical protein